MKILDWLHRKIFNRDFTIKLNYLLDNFLPPIIRDNAIFMYPLFWLVFKDKTKLLFKFKEQFPFLDYDQYIKYYEIVGGIARETDLNSKCINYILDNIYGETVLDAGCGGGFLVRQIELKLPRVKTIYGMDILVDETKEGKITYVRGFLEKMPFDTKSFDTVICSHTLEHVIDIDRAMSELRRVARNRIIIVVPKQREWLYTPDLHISFFPYKFDVYMKLKLSKSAKVIELGGDWVVIEDIK
jgi:Methylase involved in ubiquinone/menaquinone biosynthesis